MVAQGSDQDCIPDRFAVDAADCVDLAGTPKCHPLVRQIHLFGVITGQHPGVGLHRAAAPVAPPGALGAGCDGQRYAENLFDGGESQADFIFPGLAQICLKRVVFAGGNVAHCGLLDNNRVYDIR